MTIHVQDSIEDERTISEEIRTVLGRLSTISEDEVTILAIADPEACGTLAEAAGITDQDAFRKNCQDADTSISYRAQGQEVIVLKLEDTALQADNDALRGLIAHELMHTIQRGSGLEDDIQRSAHASVDKAVNQLQEAGHDEETIRRFISRVNGTAIFCLKDLYANTELIEQGFSAELVAYYERTITDEVYCPVPDFYGEEASLREIEDAIAFELQLLPSWLPHAIAGDSAADEVKSKIIQCYEKNIPDVARYMHGLEDVAGQVVTEGADAEQFFDTVLEHALSVIEDKDQLLAENEL